VTRPYTQDPSSLLPGVAVSLNNAEDIVDVLSEQHHQLRQLCKEVHAATGYDK